MEIGTFVAVLERLDGVWPSSYDDDDDYYLKVKTSESGKTNVTYTNLRDLESLVLVCIDFTLFPFCPVLKNSEDCIFPF